jgi:hypothetical protein
MKQTAVVAAAVLVALLLWAGLRFVPNQLMMRTSAHTP